MLAWTTLIEMRPPFGAAFFVLGVFSDLAKKIVVDRVVSVWPCLWRWYHSAALPHRASQMFTGA